MLSLSKIFCGLIGVPNDKVNLYYLEEYDIEPDDEQWEEITGPYSSGDYPSMYWRHAENGCVLEYSDVGLFDWDTDEFAEHDWVAISADPMAVAIRQVVGINEN